jgi:hypothetical protein
MEEKRERLEKLKNAINEKTKELQDMIDEFKNLENSFNEQKQVYEMMFKKLVEMGDRYTGVIPVHFLNYFQKWSFNRKVDRQRVQTIFSDMQKNYIVHGLLPSSGIITTCLDRDNYIRIIDGQHRCEAYKLFMKECNGDFSISVDIYKYQSDEKMIEIFNFVNNVKLVDPNFLNNQIQIKVKEIVETINKKFGIQVIKDRNKKTNAQVRRPYLDKPNFIQNLIEKKGDLLLFSSTENIIKSLSEINRGIGASDRRCRADSSIKANIHLNAEKLGFYLGLDKKLSWIDYLN